MLVWSGRRLVLVFQRQVRLRVECAVPEATIQNQVDLRVGALEVADEGHQQISRHPVRRGQSHLARLIAILAGHVPHDGFAQPSHARGQAPHGLPRRRQRHPPAETDRTSARPGGFEILHASPDRGLRHAQDARRAVQAAGFSDGEEDADIVPVQPSPGFPASLTLVFWHVGSSLKHNGSSQQIIHD